MQKTYKYIYNIRIYIIYYVYTYDIYIVYCSHGFCSHPNPSHVPVVKALKTGRNDTWMAAMWKANEARGTRMWFDTGQKSCSFSEL